MLPQELAHPGQNQHALRDPGHQAALALLLRRDPIADDSFSESEEFPQVEGKPLTARPRRKERAGKGAIRTTASATAAKAMPRGPPQPQPVNAPRLSLPPSAPAQAFAASGPPPPTPEPAEPHIPVAPAFSRRVYPTQVD